MKPADLVRPEILALSAYHVADAEGMVKLDAMENPYRLPEHLARELAARLARVEINRYPNPAAPRLRARLAEAMQIPAGCEIVLGNGSDDLIQIITFTLARPGAVMLTPEPTFVVYRMNANLAGMRFVGVPLRPSLELDLEATLAAIRAEQPALVFLAYPNNPTGVLYDEGQVAEIIRAAPGLVVLDEAYHVYARRSFLPRIAEFENLAVMRTVSKMSLAGLRLGYLVARPEWTVQLDKVRQVYNVNVLTQAAAEFALEHFDVLREQAERVLAERPGVGEALAALPGTTVYPSQANFFLVRVPDSDRAYQRLRAQGVLVRNFNGAHPMLANCLRVTVGTPEENRILITAMREALT
ncbi:MAG TPA: histidinol-phosphate transaminase [Burkholderiales bacterium]|jgi:histidinol-phosphate aminotransferase|nr:histidinol-phosphate transaminase [Burkholderiales bacterium]